MNQNSLAESKNMPNHAYEYVKVDNDKLSS